MTINAFRLPTRSHRSEKSSPVICNSWKSVLRHVLRPPAYSNRTDFFAFRLPLTQTKQNTMTCHLRGIILCPKCSLAGRYPSSSDSADPANLVTVDWNISNLPHLSTNRSSNAHRLHPKQKYLNSVTALSIITRNSNLSGIVIKQN